MQKPSVKLNIQASVFSFYFSIRSNRGDHNMFISVVISAMVSIQFKFLYFYVQRFTIIMNVNKNTMKFNLTRAM